jgi:RNA recognition motif-containing protein
VRRDRDRYPGRDGARDKQPRRAAETDKAKAPQSYNEKLGHFKKETVQKKDVAEESFTVKLLFFALPLAKPTADVKLQVENALNGFGFKGIEMEEDEEGKHKGEALVRFRDIACAKRAHAFISGKNIKGTVYQACPEGQRPVAVVPAPIEVQQPTNQVEITNLIPDLTQMDIRERFKRYGTIKSVTVTRSPSGKVRLNNVAT